MQPGNEKMNRLIHCFFDCYEYHLRGIDIRGFNSKKRPPTSDLHLAKAKEFLKRQYIKYTGLNLKEYTPFSNLKTSLQGQIKDIRNLNITEDEKLEKELELIEESAIKEIQYLLLKLEGTFTTALSTFSYEGQKRLIRFLFDYFMENEIPIWEEMHELIKQQEMRSWIYWMLKKKTCVISGKPAQLAHDKSAGSMGGYKYDGLIGNSYLPLAVEYHMGIDHGVGGGRNKLDNLLIEHNIYYEEDGMKKAYWFEIKTEQEAKLIKKVYPHHGKAFGKE